jgi:hypothetical protein
VTPFLRAVLFFQLIAMRKYMAVGLIELLGVLQQWLWRCADTSVF